MEREFTIIDQYFKSISAQAEGVVEGPGDDCAILSFPAGFEACLSTDTLLEDVHFPRGCPPSVIASRTLGANLSDLAAMGAKPHSFLLALTLPEADETWLRGFSEALSALIKIYDLPLVGGNLSQGHLSLSVTIIGVAPVGRAVRRVGAKAGHDIFVTGTLGDAAQGLERVKAGDYGGYLASRYCAPTPRLEAGIVLREYASAMIDISDGLMADLGHICESSELGAVIESVHLPLSKELLASLSQERATQMALFAGDDYELCFTVDPLNADKMLAALKETEVKVTRIGQMRAGQEVVAVDSEGSPIRHDGAGYQHF